MLLHLPRDLQLAVQSLALRRLPSDCRRQTGNLLRQRGLGSRFRFDTVQSSGDGAFCKFISFVLVPRDEIGGEALLVPIVPQRAGDEVPQPAISRRRDVSEKLFESRTAGIEKQEKCLSSLAWILHGEAPKPLVKKLRLLHTASSAVRMLLFRLRGGR